MKQVKDLFLELTPEEQFGLIQEVNHLKVNSLWPKHAPSLNKFTLMLIGAGYPPHGNLCMNLAINIANELSLFMVADMGFEKYKEITSS